MLATNTWSYTLPLDIIRIVIMGTALEKHWDSQLKSVLGIYGTEPQAKWARTQAQAKLPINEQGNQQAHKNDARNQIKQGAETKNLTSKQTTSWELRPSECEHFGGPSS